MKCISFIIVKIACIIRNDIESLLLSKNINEVHIVKLRNRVMVTTLAISPSKKANLMHGLCYLFWPQSVWRLVSGIQIIFLRSILILAKLLLWKMCFKKKKKASIQRLESEMWKERACGWWNANEAWLRQLAALDDMGDKWFLKHEQASGSWFSVGLAKTAVLLDASFN